jgi:ABC-type sugar transport system ATPase subunit
MSFLKVNHISRTQDGAAILKEISFIQSPFQKMAIAGETGSGKSTLLKIIAGLTQPHTGEVRFEDVRVEGPAEKLIPGHPGVAYLSQQFELPKFLTVTQILQYANKLPASVAKNLYEICRITHLLKRKTDQLSGGEQQRIALARLLTGSPKLLLLDEPFSNLDMIHKSLLKTVIRDIGEQLHITCILVSHDPLDTLSWADEIIILKEGKIVQQATPEQIYRQPVNEYAAALFGKYNLLSTSLSARFSALGNTSNQGKRLLIRPDQFTMSIHKTRGLKANVQNVFFSGSVYDYELTIEDEVITVRVAGNTIAKGDNVHVYVSPGGIWAI